jgi:hypothetical protein
VRASLKLSPFKSILSPTTAGQFNFSQLLDGGDTMSKRGIPFIALGTAFLGIGITSQRTFLYVGIAFLVIGLLLLRRPRR